MGNFAYLLPALDEIETTVLKTDVAVNYCVCVGYRAFIAQCGERKELRRKGRQQ
jgi:hypothetical protein